MPRGRKKKVRKASSSFNPASPISSTSLSSAQSATPSPPSTPEHTQTVEVEMVDPNNRNLYEYATPILDGLQHSIRRPAVQENNFEIKPATIQLVQSMGTFGGSPVEDPNSHILNFLEIFDTFKHNSVTDDAIRLILFPFSLRDKAKVWLHSLPQGSITTWEELAQKFLAKYFPLGKTAKMRNDITSFLQYDSETLYEAWERFKDLLRRCPHHGMPKWLQVQTFYNGLSSGLKTTIDAAAGGALMAKPVDKAYNLLETMSSNNYQWQSDRNVSGKVAGIQDNEMFSVLTSQIAALTKEVKSLGIQGAVKAVNHSIQPWENCGEGHTSDQCPLVVESVQYLGNRNANNPYSNTYNPGWRNHPNFFWSQNQGAGSSAVRPNNPPGFNVGGFNQQAKALPPPTEKKPSMEEMMMLYMSKNDAIIQSQNSLIQSQSASLRNLETQVGQLANALNSRQQGTLPSDTETNPRREGKEHCKAITLRSGREIVGNPKTAEYEKSKEAEHEVVEKPIENSVVEDPEKVIVQPRPPPPFPQRFYKHIQDKQFRKFLDVLKQLHINIPLEEALEQMPNYAKFMKELITKKRRLGEFETVALTEECCAIL